MKSLICTFGFDDGKIVEAIKSISHDEIFIITGEDNLEQDSYLRLIRLCRALGTPIGTITTDVFDLMESFEVVLALIRRLKADGKEVKMNISGGLPLLSNAALLAAFNEGVVSYYVDDRVLKLPVLRNVTVGERLSKEQKDVLRKVGNGIVLSDIGGRFKKDSDIKRSLIDLKTLGLVRYEANGNGGRIVLTKEGESMRDWLALSEKRS